MTRVATDGQNASPLLFVKAVRSNPLEAPSPDTGFEEVVEVLDSSRPGCRVRELQDGDWVLWYSIWGEERTETKGMANVYNVSTMLVSPV